LHVAVYTYLLPILLPYLRPRVQFGPVPDPTPRKEGWLVGLVSGWIYRQREK